MGGWGGVLSNGGSEAVPSVEKNLAVDDVGSKALHVVLLLLLHRKHQSIRVANPSDKIDKLYPIF